MSIESDLRKDGINVIDMLDTASINTLANRIAKRISNTFKEFGFVQGGLFERISRIPMYVAEIPKGMSEASYFYKNSSIYFRDGMGLEDLEKYAVHEVIHNIQEIKDENGNLLRLGLSKFDGAKVTGMALNEAAVQILTSNALDYTFENVEYYGINFSTISPDMYPLICNIMSQMAYITGENALYDSTFNSNDNFKNKFSSYCGEKTYNKISQNLDNILNIEEKIIKLENILQTEDLKARKLEQISNKILNYKEKIKNIYFNTQEIITTSYFDNMYKTLITEVEIENFRKELYDFKELIGTASNYFFFNNYYIKMMEKLDTRYDMITDNIYLIPKKESRISAILNMIKNLVKMKNF